jgi:hypothetical protein
MTHNTSPHTFDMDDGFCHTHRRYCNMAEDAPNEWHCTRDGVTTPCRDCDGCRYDRAKQRADSTG